MRWLTTIKRADEGKLVLERMELDETGFPQPTGELDEPWRPTPWVLALGQECDLSLVEDVPDIEVVDVVVTVGPNLMTGHAGVFAGGDMVPALQGGAFRTLCNILNTLLLCCLYSHLLPSLRIHQQQRFLTLNVP